MNKKMIAAMLSFTLIFVFVFAACGGNNSATESTTINTVYANNSDYPCVTDADGNKIYSPDGEYLVYATDNAGNKVTNSKGEYETVAEPFVPVSEEGKVEYYGYIITLPEGWTIINESDRYENVEAKHRAAISVINKDYEEYYEAQRNTYEALIAEDPNCASWAENVSIGSGCIKVVRFTLQAEGKMNIMYFFENSGNLYKIFIESDNADEAIADSLTFCKAITYKPYVYYPEVETEEETESTTEQ